ncbi:helicase-like transcription factor CHR28 isoform X2 [Punica granatum]|uniref:Helicase-like transcription factor CHR28 isoform X2 n=1 Tax=Punica granatum TaxID=22663 RepID=A0A6P8DLN1_PUNGR|nr:helicase-like transcription factor CHR28 isoform X2 [Punica granatum]
MGDEGPRFGGFEDFYAAENDHLTIDLQSLMELLDEEPDQGSQGNSEDLSREFLTSESVPAVGKFTHTPPENGYLGSEGAFATGDGISCNGNFYSSWASEGAKTKKVEIDFGIGGSSGETVMDSFRAPGSNSYMDNRYLDVPLQGGALFESSMCHNYTTIFGDRLPPFVDPQRIPLHHADSYQSFPSNTNMFSATKNERGTFQAEEGANLASEAGSERWGNTSTSFSEILPDDVSGTMGYDLNEFDYHFPLMGGSYSSAADNEVLEQPLTWNSLYTSTWSSNKPVVTDEDIVRKSYSVADEKSGVTMDVNPSPFLVSPFTTLQPLRDLKKAEEEGMGKPPKRARDDIDGFTYRSPMEDRNLKKEFSGQFAACSQPPAFINKPLSGIKDESSSTSLQLGSTATHHPSNCSPESTQSNMVDCRSHAEDESDICIIEEMSHPAPSNQSGKLTIFQNRSTLSDSHHHTGVGVAGRLRTNSERQIFRVALQDLAQPKSEVFPPDGVLAVPLLRHQRIALSWMIKKETAVNCSGGILADDQGLGKTISTIALIVKERPPPIKPDQNKIKHEELQTLNLDEDGEEKIPESNGATMDSKLVQAPLGGLKIKTETSCPLVQRRGRPAAGTLVVCPTSVLRQWADELHNKVTQKVNLSVLVYHGGNRTKDPFELAKYDVVLTTYSIVSMEVPKQPLVDKEDDENGKTDDHGLPRPQLSSSKKRKYPPGPNKRRSKDGKEVEGALLECAAGPLSKVGWFRVVLDEAQSIKNHRTQVARACWGLRAKRRWCLSGTPIQNAIDDLYSYFRFLRYDPYDVYNTFCSNIKAPIHRSPAKGYKKLQAILKTIMLRRTKGTLLDGEPIITLPPKLVKLEKVEFSKEERDFYSRLEADSRAQFEEYAAAGTVKENYVNILLMLLRLRQACDHPLLVRGYDSTSAWKASLQVAKQLPREKQKHLLNCLEASLAICTICNDPPEEAVVSICGHVFCNQCMCEHLTGDETDCPALDCKVRLSRSSVFSRESLSNSLSDQLHVDKPVSSFESKAEERAEPCLTSSPCGSSKIRAALEVLQSISRTRECHSGAGPMQDSSNGTYSGNSSDLRGNPAETSSSEDKVESLKELNKIVGMKAIVFSQWTRMLDLLEVCLKSSSIQFRRLDGTMSVIARDKAVKDFNTLPEVTVMIMSLKAASLGLNMVSACHVLLMDLWWNPTTEDQAVDRAHRIGQTRPVTVLRLTVKDTVEDRILALQQKKRVMVASAFGEDEAGSRQSRLTVEDLKYLFMV